MDNYDLCCIVKEHLDWKGVQHAKSRNNIPSMSGQNLFLREMEKHSGKECLKILEDHELLYNQIQSTIF